MKRQTRIASIIIAAAGIAVADPVVPQVVYPTHEMDAVQPVVPVPPAPVTRPEGQVVQITRPSFGVRTRNILIVADRSATQLATAHGLTLVQEATPQRITVNPATPQKTLMVMTVPEDRDIAEVLAKLRADPGIRYAEREFVRPYRTF